MSLAQALECESQGLDFRNSVGRKSTVYVEKREDLRTKLVSNRFKKIDHFGRGLDNSQHEG
jgi:hypothetical protein